MHVVMENELSFPAPNYLRARNTLSYLLRYLLCFVSVGMNLTFVNSAVRVVLDHGVINIS